MTWRYGKSNVEFATPSNTVRQWTNRGNLRVHMRPGPNSTGAPYFTLPDAERVEVIEPTVQSLLAVVGVEIQRALRADFLNRLATIVRENPDIIGRAMHDVSGGAKVDHGSGGTVPLRRSKTLPLWEPFPVTGRVGRFIPWSCIARSVWRAGTG